MKQPETLNTEFEQHLTQALRPVDAPDGFADRVMARAHAPAPAPAKVLTMPVRVRAWITGGISGAIAAALLVGVYTGEQVHQRRQYEKAARAQQQFDTGMRITDETLDRVRLQLQQAGIPGGE